MNFYEQIKKDIISSLRTNKRFRNLDFLDNIQELNPNHFNLSRAVGVVSILNLNKIENDSFCDDFRVKQLLTVEYHIKPDVKASDWESYLNVIQAEIIYTLKEAQEKGTLFTNPQDFDFNFIQAGVGQLKKNDVKTKIYSKATIVQYEIEYDLKKVIGNEQI